MKRAWVLNFDADDELAKKGSYAPQKAVVARMRALAARTGSLLADGDVLVDGSEGNRAAGLAGRAFCPTPSALRALEAAGASSEPHPDLAVLKRVNHRLFALELGPTLPGACFVTTREQAVAVCVELGPLTGWVLAKRPFGFAGRGRRRLSCAPNEADLAWIEASLRDFGGLVLEPWVSRICDFGQHGYVARSGEITLGEPTLQHTLADGAWLETRILQPGEVDVSTHKALREEGEKVGEALKTAGYFGPFGVDLFSYEGAPWGEAAVCLQPRSDVNARYSMGWAVGMVRHRVDLLEPR